MRSGVRMRPEQMGMPGRGREHFILRQRVECGRAEALGRLHRKLLRTTNILAWGRERREAS